MSKKEALLIVQNQISEVKHSLLELESQRDALILQIQAKYMLISSLSDTVDKLKDMRAERKLTHEKLAEGSY